MQSWRPDTSRRNLAQQRRDAFRDPPDLLEDARQVELPGDDADGTGDGQALCHDLGAGHGLRGKNDVQLRCPTGMLSHSDEPNVFSAG